MWPSPDWEEPVSRSRKSRWTVAAVLAIAAWTSGCSNSNGDDGGNAAAVELGPVDVRPSPGDKCGTTVTAARLSEDSARIVLQLLTTRRPPADPSEFCQDVAATASTTFELAQPIGSRTLLQPTYRDGPIPR